jgi:hypothetical protein
MMRTAALLGAEFVLTGARARPGGVRAAWAVWSGAKRHPERRISLAEAGGRCVALTSGRDREALAEHLIARPSQGRPPVVAALTSGFTGACSSAAHAAYEIEMRGVWCGVG